MPQFICTDCGRVGTVADIKEGLPAAVWWDKVRHKKCINCVGSGLVVVVPPCPGPQTSIHDSQIWLHAQSDEGVECPTCGNYTRVYKRVLNSGMARALVAIYRSFGRGFGHLPSLRLAHADDTPARGLYPLGNEEPKMRYWCLLEEDLTRQGYYRVTDTGEDWVLGHSHVPKYALIVNTRCVGLEGPPWSIRDALGTKFNLVDLLNEPPFPVPAAVFP